MGHDLVAKDRPAGHQVRSAVSPNARFERGPLSLRETLWIGSAEDNAGRYVDADTPVKAASRSA